MIRTLSTTALAIALSVASLSVPTVAEACSCLPPTVQSSWNNADEVFAGRVVSERIISNYRVYDIQITRDGNGCRTPGTRVQLATLRSAATCGTSFAVGGHYLFFADLVSIAGSRRLLTNACAGNTLVSNLTSDDITWLRTRYVPCSNSCVDPNVPVLQCLVDPCTLAPACAQGTCEPNYCGGCTAEFYDTSGYQVCTP